MNAPAGVALRRLEKRFGDVAALHPLDLDIDPGELVVLVGPSGCGKTTVLRLVAGLEDPTGGAVRIGERDVTAVEPAERDVAMVFQSYALYPHMTVRENLAFGLRMRRTPAAEAARRLTWATSVLGLDPLLDRRPAELSGGQKQRVAFGRAMVREPRVFLFDEPLSNLDARLRADMRREIADLHARLGATMMYVTHDQVEAMTLGQRIAVMRDGRLQQFAPPLEVYRRPANLYVAGFIGTPAINLAEAAVVQEAGLVLRAGCLCLPLAARPSYGEADRHDRPDGGRPFTLGVRPENLCIGAVDAADVVARVARVEHLGNEALVHVEGPTGTPWVARAPAGQEVRAGDVIGLRVDVRALLLFDAAGGRVEAAFAAEAHG